MSKDESRPYEYADDGIGKSELLLRRLRRSSTYTRAVEELIDRTVHWPKIRRTISSSIEEREDDFTIVQIGANDGNRNDFAQEFVRQEGTQSLLVEPVPVYYDMLEKRYRDDASVKLAQVAVDSVAGSVTIHAVTPHSRLRGSSSIHPEVIESAAWLLKDNDTSAITTPIEVPTLTLEGLLEAYAIPHVDWLVVDTEGHDKVIMDQVTEEFIALRGLKHAIWERMHLTQTEQKELITRFKAMDFKITNTRRDTFATRR